EQAAPAADLEATPRIEPLPSPEPTVLAGRSATDRALARRPEAFRDYFDFRHEPFAHDHDPRFFFHSQCHWEAFTTLNRWVETGPALAVLFGEHGSGKTFVTACLARRLGLISPRTVLVWPDRETARRNDLILEAVLAASEKYGGSAEHGRSPLEIWHTLLSEVRRNGALFVFLIDDAHQMSRDNMRRLVELLEHPNLRHAARILLTGEEQLRDLVAAPPLADHLGVTCYLSPMTAEDVAAYVQHRLRLAAEEDAEAPPLFTPRALQLLATYSGGIPRLINNVADAALYYAYLQGAGRVTPDLLSAAVDRLALAEARPAHA
ncbi:MAG: ExeA family protein, partial [Planctomycetota bacterium]